MKILAVEDDDLVRRFVIGQLKSMGYDVVGAASGEEAMLVLRDDKEIDLLFTDLIMPGGMMGTDLADEAEKLKPGIRVLYTTGSASDVFERQPPGGRNPAKLVRKPYRKAQLARMVREALEA